MWGDHLHTGEVVQGDKSGAQCAGLEASVTVRNCGFQVSDTTLSSSFTRRLSVERQTHTSLGWAPRDHNLDVKNEAMNIPGGSMGILYIMEGRNFFVVVTQNLESIKFKKKE